MEFVCTLKRTSVSNLRLVSHDPDMTNSVFRSNQTDARSHTAKFV